MAKLLTITQLVEDTDSVLREAVNGPVYLVGEDRKVSYVLLPAEAYRRGIGASERTVHEVGSLPDDVAEALAEDIAEDVFVHSRVLNDCGVHSLMQGQKLLIKIDDAGKGPQVQAVRLLDE